MTPEDLRTQVMDAICNSFALRDRCGGYRCKQCEREADVVIPLILEAAVGIAAQASVEPGFSTNEHMMAFRIANAIRALKGAPNVQQA